MTERVTVIYKVVTSDNKTYIGPIRGSGGMIFTSSKYYYISSRSIIGRERALAEAGRPLSIYEPKKGCFAIYPDFCAESDGEKIVVQFAGTKISAVHRNEMKKK